MQTRINLFFLKLIFLTLFYKTSKGESSSYNEELKIYNYIVNPHNFTFLINPGERICSTNGGDHLLAVFYVHTAPGNYKRRLAIRETWGSREQFPNKGLIFVMGTTKNATQNGIIRLEDEKYHDIVQFSFVDDYKNLTYKAIMSMKWVSMYCQKAKFIVKTDDDVIIDMHFLYRVLTSRIENKFPMEKTIYCNVLKKMRVSRDYYNWWYVEKSEYAAEYYGPYCSGLAFIVTSDLSSLIYNTSFYMKYFWIDDYYITGALLRNINSTYVPLGKWMTFIDNEALKHIQGHNIGNFMFTLSVKSIDEIYIVWSYLKDFYSFDQDLHFFS